LSHGRSPSSDDWPAARRQMRDADRGLRYDFGGRRRVPRHLLRRRNVRAADKQQSAEYESKFVHPFLPIAGSTLQVNETPRPRGSLHADS
jgi:hypothetical protein